MKNDTRYMVILGDGMADRPLKELGGKTPLEAANTPNMDRLAQEGTCCWVKTVPKGMPPGSDVANLSVMGYDPQRFYTGRAPIEAASMGVELKEGDIAFRCNLVTIENGVMKDYSAGHISSEEAAELIASLQEALGDERFSFHPGVSYRHLMVWRGGPKVLECTPPHDISDQEIAEHLPKGEGSTELLELMEKAREILANHPVNSRRAGSGKNPANSVWFWGEGPKPWLPAFEERFGLNGGVISAVDLVKGIGVLAGLKPVSVPGATGYIDTNYQGKVDAAIEILSEGQFVYIHIEAPDEAGHQGSVETKIRAIEDVDSKVVAPLVEWAKGCGKRVRILLTPAHPTPIEIKTHSSDPVPFVIWDSERPVAGAEAYNERAFEHLKPYTLEPGFKVMYLLVQKICTNCTAGCGH